VFENFTLRPAAPSIVPRSSASPADCLVRDQPPPSETNGVTRLPFAGLQARFAETWPQSFQSQQVVASEKPPATSTRKRQLMRRFARPPK